MGIEEQELKNNRIVQRHNLNKVHSIVNECFNDYIDNSAEAYIENYMEPGIGSIIDKQTHIMKATQEYVE